MCKEMYNFVLLNNHSLPVLHRKQYNKRLFRVMFLYV
jgi:hypothetical protein